MAIVKRRINGEYKFFFYESRKIASGAMTTANIAIAACTLHCPEGMAAFFLEALLT